MKTSLKTENSATAQIPEIKSICKKNCRVCCSKYVKEIHNLRDDRVGFKEIIKIIKKKYNYHLSTSSLCRHFQNYNERRRIIAAEVMNKDLVEESTEQARHTKQIVVLIDRALNHIESHNMKFDITDLKKLFEIRHQVLGGDNSGEGDLITIFQTAIDKHGVDVNQGVLWKKANRPNE